LVAEVCLHHGVHNVRVHPGVVVAGKTPPVCVMQSHDTIMSLVFDR
jgi:hypothetical protein